MFFKQIFTPGLAIHSYLLGDEKSKKCIVIDPTRHVIPFIMEAQNNEFDITAILETHVHADYVSGAKELKHQLNEKPRIYCSGMGGKEWIPHYADVIVDKESSIHLGDLRLKALHTPGHTAEHVMWVCYDESRSATVPWFMFTGDGLFVGSIGRPDLLGKEEMKRLAPMLYHTLFEVLAPLPDFVEIFPTHGEGSLCGKSLRSRPSSTIGYERLFNPYLKKSSPEVWISEIQKESIPTPPYFSRMKKLNIQGPPLLNSLSTKIWNSTSSETPPLNDLFLLDVRHIELFAVSHLQGSLNIPFSHFNQWAGWVVPPTTPIGLIIEHTHLYSEVVDQLRLMGFDQDVWVIQWNNYQQEFSSKLSSFSFIEVDELAKLLLKPNEIYLLDIRRTDEWESEHILPSHHLELNELIETNEMNRELKELPRDHPIALLCRSGQRASIAASILKKNGFSSLFNVRGGIQAWKQAGLPLSTVITQS